MREIHYIHTEQLDLVSIYGFGSFFRSERASDCDLLLVVNDQCSNLGLLHADLSKAFSELGERLSIVFDLTILTEREHMRAPLREHDNLIDVSIAQRKNT
jgi:predicted nucleotidyltransferase